MRMCVQCGCVAWCNEPSLQNKALQIQTQTTETILPDLQNEFKTLPCMCVSSDEAYRGKRNEPAANKPTLAADRHLIIKPKQDETER